MLISFFFIVTEIKLKIEYLLKILVKILYNLCVFISLNKRQNIL